MLPTLKAGVTLDFTTTVPGYPASAGWTLKFYLVRPATALITLVASAEGDAYRVQQDAVQTGAWTPGAYTWEARVSNGAGVEHEVGAGQVEVRPNIAAQTSGADLRSQAQKALDDALAAYAAWTPTQRRFQIGDRSVEYSAKDEIQAAIRFWRNRVEAEQAAAEGRAAGPLGRMRFGVPN